MVGFRVCDCSRTLLSECYSVSSKGGPVSIVDRSCDVDMLRIQQVVPNSMQFVNTVVRRQGEQIGAFISSRVIRTVLTLGVERLVHIADVVN